MDFKSNCEYSYLVPQSKLYQDDERDGNHMSKEHADLGDGLSLNSNKIIFHGLKPNSSNFSFFKYSASHLEQNCHAGCYQISTFDMSSEENSFNTECEKSLGFPFGFFRNDVNFSQMTINNWFLQQDGKVKEVLEEESSLKDESLTQELKDLLNINKESNQDKRKDICMKAALRKIHRDIKQDFYEFTCFDFNKIYREKGYFTKCLSKYALSIFGDFPSQTEKLVLASLISAKWTRKYIEREYFEGSLEKNNYKNQKSICNLVHQTLYCYSEQKLDCLAKIDGINAIFRKYTQICELKNLKPLTLQQ